MKALAIKNQLNPIYNPSEFFIHTPMMEELKQQLHSWLWNGISGGVILGNYRIGKTSAIRHLSNQLVNRLNEKIPVCRMTISGRDVKTVASVFKNLCFSLNKTLKSRATSDDMANDLLHYFGEIAMSNSTKQVVLLVDEMQRLHIRQLEAFAELHDGLTELNVNLSVFFIGNQASAQPLLEMIMVPENELIRGRFFTKSYLANGIRNISEVSACLREYDNNGSTEYFLTSYNDSNWRLESLSQPIWDVYSEQYKSNLKLKSWGMQYFVSMVKILLIDYLPKYAVEDTEAIQEMIVESINASGLVPDLVEVMRC